MKNRALKLSIVSGLCISLFACSNSDNGNKGGGQDSGAGGSSAGGSAGTSSSGGAPSSGGKSGSGGTSNGGSGGDSHHGGAGGAGASGSGGKGGMMVDGGMMDAMMDGAMMDGGLEAPMMQSVEPLSGGLHVMWMNMTKNCDKVELLRNKNGGAYAVAYTLAGSATSQHDAQVTSPGTYCYKARCVKGSETSPESNEKCGMP